MTSVDTLLSSTGTEKLRQSCSSAGARIRLTTEKDDSQLMLAYADGNASAFEQLYARHKQALFRYVRSCCGIDAVAHELYQDIWLRVIKGRSSYQADTAFNAWLYRIARNRMIDHYRQQPAIADTQFDPDMSASRMSHWVIAPLRPDEIAELSQRAHVLDAALQALPAAQREAVLLRHIAGMSLQEVAELLDEGAETIKSRLRYATARLRSQLQELLQ